MTNPKEPKYWLCDDAPPPAWRGPGDKPLAAGVDLARTSTSRLFEPAAPHQPRGESTPFYLWSRGAHRRIAEALPEVRLIAVVRDPIDRRLQQLDAPVVRRPRAGRGLRDGVRAPGRPDPTRAGRRSGATASSGGTASSSSTCSGTSTRSGSSCCATATSWTSRRAPVDPPAGSSASRRATWRASRRTTPATSWSRAGARACSGPVVRAGARLGQFARRRSGAGPARRRPAQRDRRAPPAHAWPSSAPRLLPHFAEDIHRLSRSPAMTSGTGLDREQGFVPQRSWLRTPEPRLLTTSSPARDPAQRTSVTRSCAPSGRAAST